MNLLNFINYNKNCPICENKLSLYMYSGNRIRFKSNYINNTTYGFYNDDKNSLHNYIECNINFETGEANTIDENIKVNDLYFFLLCNEKGFDENGDINPYDGCYFRSSPFMRFNKQENKTWKLEIINPDFKNKINLNEVLSFHYKNDMEKSEKHYLLELDNELNKINFMYYSLLNEQLHDDKFEPNVFEKEIDLLPTTKFDFSLSKREQLINKFESWLLFS